MNTTGQMVTDAERKFWEQESDATLAVITGTETPDLNSTEEAAASANFRAIKFMLIYSIIGGVAFGIMQYLSFRNGTTLFPGFPGIGAGLGVGVGLQRWRVAEAKRAHKP